MSRSDYLNLNKAYLSNVKQQIKENYGSCYWKQEPCNVGQQQTKESQVYDGSGAWSLFDWYPATCNRSRTANCPDDYRYGADCIIGPWSSCNNGQQTRKIIPAVRAGTCSSNVTSQSCGTPCEYEKRTGSCTCTPDSTTNGTIGTEYVLTKSATNGGKCDPPPASTKTSCNVNSCGPDFLLRKLINGYHFTTKDTSNGQNFVDAFKITINSIKTGEKTKFLTDILNYLENFYSSTITSASNKCAIENFKFLINEVYQVRLPSSKIPLPPTTACSL